MKHRHFLAVAMMTWMAAGFAEAQDVGPVSGSRVQQLLRGAARRLEEARIVPSGFDASQCDQYVLVIGTDDTSKDTDLTTIASCLNAVTTALKEASTKPSSPALNRDIIQFRINYKRLKKWIPDHPPTTPPSREWMDARKAELDAARQLTDALKKHDLFATFAAVLVTGATLVDASQPDEDGAAAEAAADAKTSDGAEQGAQALGTIVWQSRHFGDESIRVLDWSVGGRIGVQPVLNLVTATPASDAPDDGAPGQVSAVHQNAFVWTFGVQGHKPIRGINSELGGYVSTGSSTLTALPKAIDKGEGSFIAFPLDYGTQKTAWLWEAGAMFNIFDNPLEQIHAEKGTTTPQFQALVAIRRDERFRGNPYGSYRSPMGRLLFRLTLDAIRVIDRRQFGEPSRPFTFGFVVEHERSLAFTGARVPSATRFVLRGDVNLLNALDGTPAAAEEGGEEEGEISASVRPWSVTFPGSPSLTLDGVPTRVTVSLTSLTVSEKLEKPDPPPMVSVSPGRPGLFAIPACPGATISLALKEGVLSLALLNGGGCALSAMEFAVTGDR